MFKKFICSEDFGLDVKWTPFFRVIGSEIFHKLLQKQSLIVIYKWKMTNLIEYLFVKAIYFDIHYFASFFWC